MRVFDFTALVAALGVAAPAFAGGLDPLPAEPVLSVPAPVPVSTDYDWTGLSVGGQLSYGDVTTTGPELEGDGALYGLRAYYDYDLGNVIVGGGLQYDAANIDLGGAAEISDVLRLAGRVGAGSGRNWYYGTAGFAQASLDDGTASPGNSNGYFLGAGYETFVTDQVTVGAEVLYHQFEDFDIDTLDADVTTAGLSVNYRF